MKSRRKFHQWRNVVHNLYLIFYLPFENSVRIFKRMTELRCVTQSCPCFQLHAYALLDVRLLLSYNPVYAPL